jgi:outer membrane protein TolC
LLNNLYFFFQPVDSNLKEACSHVLFRLPAFEDASIMRVPTVWDRTPKRLGVFLLTWMSTAACAFAQERIPLAPTGQIAPSTMGAQSLADCLHIGLARQPALAAQQATVASAERQSIALEHMKLASLVSREMPFRKEQACLGVSIAQAGLQVAEWETIYAITRCYIMVAYAKKQEGVVKNLLVKMEESYKIADSAVKKGDPDSPVTQQDAEKLAINIDLVRIRLIEASVGVERATAALREAMGLRYDDPLVPLADELPAVTEFVDRDQIIQLALARRGELTQVETVARVAELEVCAQNTGGLLPVKRTFASGSDIHSVPIPQGNNNGTYRPAAVGIEMPVTMVGSKADRVARAQELSYRTASVVEKTHNLVALEAEDAYYKWKTAAAQIKVLRDSAVTSSKLADSIAQRFNNNPGKVSSEDFLRARTLDEQTQAQLNEALYHHALALAALERVTAGGFTPSYRRP